LWSDRSSEPSGADKGPRGLEPAALALHVPKTGFGSAQLGDSRGDLLFAHTLFAQLLLCGGQEPLRESALLDGRDRARSPSERQAKARDADRNASPDEQDENNRVNAGILRRFS